MIDIQRYAPWPQEWPQEDPNGDLVEYEDHKKIVDALQARAERLEAALTQIVEKQFVRTMSYDRSAQFYAAAVGELKEIARAALKGAAE